MKSVLKNTKILKTWKRNFVFKAICWTCYPIFSQIWNHIMKTVFPNFFVCFLFSQHSLYRTVNSCWSCGTQLHRTGWTLTSQHCLSRPAALVFICLGTQNYTKKCAWSFKDLCVFTFLHFFQTDFLFFYSHLPKIWDQN